MGVGGDWPAVLSQTWADHSTGVPLDTSRPCVEGLIDVVAALYHHDPSLEEMARSYVSRMTAADRPAWAAAGRSVWSMGLWRHGDEDSALLQLILAELDLQKEIRNPHPEPPGGPTGIGAASNNLGVAYSSMRMWELAQPHLVRAAEISQSTYGPALRLQVCADLANLAESGLREALYLNAVDRGDDISAKAARVAGFAQRMADFASEIDLPDAIRMAQVLQIGARSLSDPATMTIDDRDDLLGILEQPVFGDEPGEVIIRAVTARVCRLVGDRQGCYAQADRVAAMNSRAYQASMLVTLSEAAAAESGAPRTSLFAAEVARDAESTRRRILTAFRARLTLAGLEQQYEALSQDRGRLQAALEDALRQEAELVHAATHDALTALPNRALLEQRLDAALRNRAVGTHLAIAYIDIDDFKQVNDTHGHAAGDAVLRWIADRLRCLFTDEDTVARLGGDEFAVLLAGRRSDEQIRELGLRALDSLHEPGRPFGITVSMGLAIVAQRDVNLDEVLHLADQQMYGAKRSGKGQIRFGRPQGSV